MYIHRIFGLKNVEVKGCPEARGLQSSSTLLLSSLLWLNYNKIDGKLEHATLDDPKKRGRGGFFPQPVKDMIQRVWPSTQKFISDGWPIKTENIPLSSDMTPVGLKGRIFMSCVVAQHHLFSNLHSDTSPSFWRQRSVRADL